MEQVLGLVLWFRRFAALAILVIAVLASFTIVTMTPGKYCGGIEDDIYHYPSCKWTKDISPHDLIWFKDEYQAVARGYKPCRICNPQIPPNYPTYSIVTTERVQPRTEASYLIFDTTPSSPSLFGASLIILLGISSLAASAAFVHFIRRER